MPRFILFALAMVSGSALTLQAGVNSQLRNYVGSPFRSALINFGVGLSILLIVALFTRAEATTVRQTAWWMWIGGALGTVFVVGSIVLAPRLGAGTLAAASVTGQLLMAITIDHFGLVGYRVFPITWQRIVGVALLLGGVWLIQRR